MNDERWTIVDRLLGAALERAPHERAAFLHEACGGDEALRLDVESLITHASSGTGVVSTPAGALADGIRSAGTSMMGRRVGPYVVSTRLGAGGMGDVYRARDTKLGRDVAIKVLPRIFTTDPDRRVRLEREARLLAALNHPHIGAIYGLEEMEGTPALILELVEGETLAERIAKGPIPLTEALTIARQITDALVAAHEHGVIHRDLKPANIKVRPDGTVKVLDFGLAKLAQASGIVGASQSPTGTSLAMTGKGVILGTAAYMSPEQAKGQEADRRSDVWAFGCVLLEMLTGRAAFEGDTIGELLASVLKSEPDWQRLPAETPPAIRRLLRRCLQKDEKLRLRDIGDARLEIDEAGIEEPSSDHAVAPLIHRKERLGWLAAVSVVSVIAVAIGAWPVRPTPAPLENEEQFDVLTPPVSLPFNLASFALSPDGQTLAFVAALDGQPQLWIRRLDTVEPQPVPMTGGAESPFWSPNSRSLAFYADGWLKRVDLDGGLLRPLTRSAGGGGGAWNRDGALLFVLSPGSAIFRTSADDGGKPMPVTRLETGHASHSHPRFLSDRQHFLYYVNGDGKSGGIHVGSLDGAPSKRLFDADSAAEYTSGHLLFVRQRTVWAVEFDAEALSPSPKVAFQVATGIVGTIANAGFAALSASAAGAIAFRMGSVRAGRRQFVWVDRGGKEMARLGDPHDGGFPSPSPNGSRIATMERDDMGNLDVYLLDTRRGGFDRLTTHVAEDGFPVWSRKNGRIAFTSNRNGEGLLYEMPPTEGGAAIQLGGGVAGVACDYSPDGQFLLYRSPQGDTGWNLWKLPLHEGGEASKLIETEFDERGCQFSPNGKWIAYESNRQGRFEIYIRSFPQPGEPIRMSMSGGAQVRWREDGRELFYIALDGKLMAVPIAWPADGQPPVPGTPEPLFTTRVGPASDRSESFRITSSTTAGNGFS